jgi:tetratricopeptide (TPR) repeat protein
MIFKYNNRMIACLIILALSGATYVRNITWHDSIALWKDAAKKSPYKRRIYHNLSDAYIAKGQYQEAILICEKNIALNESDYVHASSL